VSRRAETAAQALVALRRAGTADPLALAALGELSEAEAYAVQAEVLRLSGDVVAGWKVAIGPRGLAVAAPLLATTLLQSGTQLRSPGDGAAKIETELAFRLGGDLPAREAPYTSAELGTAIAEIHAAFEVVIPRLGEPGVVPFNAFLADNLGNGRTVLGTAGAVLKGIVASPQGVLRRDGTLVTSGRHPAGDPLAPLLAYANAQRDALGGLRQGQIIITGSLTGALPALGPARFEGVIEGMPTVVVEFVS